MSFDYRIIKKILSSLSIPAVVCSANVLINMTFSMLMHNTFAEGYFFAYDRHAKTRVQEGGF
jgi:hypothetical protein